MRSQSLNSYEQRLENARVKTSKLRLFFVIALTLVALAAALRSQKISHDSPPFIREVPWQPNCNSNPEEGPPEPVRNPGVRMYEAENLDIYRYSEHLAEEQGCKHSKTEFQALRKFMTDAADLNPSRNCDLSVIFRPFYDNLDAQYTFIKTLPFAMGSNGILKFDRITPFLANIGAGGEHHPGRIYLIVLAQKGDEFTLAVNELNELQSIDAIFYGECLAGHGPITAAEKQLLENELFKYDAQSAQRYQTALQCYITKMQNLAPFSERVAAIVPDVLSLLSKQF